MRGAGDLVDELARRRQAATLGAVETEYTFETDEGRKTLADLFDSRSQLLVYQRSGRLGVELGRSAQ